MLVRLGSNGMDAERGNQSSKLKHLQDLLVPVLRHATRPPLRSDMTLTSDKDMQTIRQGYGINIM